MALRRIVILGTGTDVGKTYVATQLARLYKQAGGACLAIKPIESGLQMGSAQLQAPTAGDAAALYQVATLGASPLYAFSDPVSPHLAARRAGAHIDIDAVLDYVRDQEEALLSSSRSLETWMPPTVDAPDVAPPDALSLIPPVLAPSFAPLSSTDAPPAGAPSVAPPSSNPTPSGRGLSGALPPICLVETAGGVFSPISESKTNWDMTLALKPAAVILVAPDSLGVLHDVQATLRALAPHTPHLLVLSEARGVDASTGTNLSEIENVVLSQLRLTLPCLSCRKGESLDTPFLFRLLAGR